MVILQRTSKQAHSRSFQGNNFTQIADNQRIRVRRTRFKKASQIKKPSLIDRVFSQRRERDSNPRYLAVQRFSRPPQSTTLPSLLW